MLVRTQKSLIFAASAAVLLAGAPMTAGAQLKPEVHTGSMIPQAPHALDEKSAGNVRKHFAQCVYRTATRKVLVMLDHSDTVAIDLPGAGIRNVNTDLSLEECLGGEVGTDESALGLTMSPLVLRDLMAEEAYLSRNQVAPLISPDAPAIVPHMISMGEQAAIAVALVEFTDCTIRHDSVGADALLRTMPGSDRERSAAAALAPALGQCLTAGQKISLKPGSVRALIAYAMWSRFARGPSVK